MILNWSPKGPIPSKDFNDFKNGFTSQMLEDMVQPRDCQVRISAAIKDEPKDASVCIEQWTKGLLPYSLF
jgi:hypothetical protein